MSVCVCARICELLACQILTTFGKIGGKEQTTGNAQSQMQRALLHESMVHRKFQVTKKVFVLGSISQM